MKRARRIIVVLGLVVAFLFPAFSDDASAELSIDLATFGVGFACVGDTSVGALFNNGAERCDPNGLENLFTTAVCTYENIVDQILGRLYCGMQFRLFGPLSALMTLFVVMVGAGFALGIIPGTPREMVLALFKFGLVYYFATESQLTIGVVYYGLMGFIQESIVVVLAHVVTPGPDMVACLSCPGGLFEKMDGVIAEFAHNAGASQDPDAPCSNGLVAMFMTFIASVPMLAMFGIGMAFQFVMVFFQMILGYFVSITGIMFLIALSPFFLSFALFNFTRSYFDKWVMYLLSFSIQIFVVVGFMGVIISLALYEDLRELYELSRPYNTVQQAEGTRLPFRNWCNICTPTEFGAFGITCEGDEEIHPESLLSNPQAVTIFATRMIKILMLAYILRQAMLVVPQVAKALGGVMYAPQLVGTDFMSGRGIQYPGMASASRGVQRFTSAGSIPDGMRRIFNPLVTHR